MAVVNDTPRDGASPVCPLQTVCFPRARVAERKRNRLRRNWAAAAGDRSAANLPLPLQTEGRAAVESSEKSGRLGVLWRFPLNRCDVQAGYDHAALVVEPHHNPAALGINGCVVGARNPIPVPAARDDDERLERSRQQKPTNISDHARKPTRFDLRRQALRLTVN